MKLDTIFLGIKERRITGCVRKNAYSILVTLVKFEKRRNKLNNNKSQKLYKCLKNMRKGNSAA